MDAETAVEVSLGFAVADVDAIILGLVVEVLAGRVTEEEEENENAVESRDADVTGRLALTLSVEQEVLWGVTEAVGVESLELELVAL